MLLKDISFSSPEKNLCFDDVLLQIAESGEQGEVLRFWESPTYFIVLGRIGKEADDVDEKMTAADGIPVLRRSSGGGTVVQGPGCLNFSLVLAKDSDPAIADLRRSYHYILGKVIKALKAMGVDAEFRPTSDIALAADQKKISGNAQKRGRRFILHHGTLLYDFDLSRIERYLKMPVDVPEYRGGRSHLQFVANVPVTQEDIKKALIGRFPISATMDNMSQAEEEALDRLLASRKLT